MIKFYYRSTDMKNANCDGSGPCSGTDGVRYLPLPGDAGLYLCRACYAHEIAWRQRRNVSLAKDARYPLPAWAQAQLRGFGV